MKKIFFVTLLSLIFSFAQAEESVTPMTSGRLTPSVEHPTTEEQDTTIILPVPQSRFSLQTLDNNYTPKKSLHIELTASSWAPEHLTGDSNLVATSDFRRAGLPQMALSGWSEGWDFAIFNVAPKVGIAFAQYQRTGYLLTSGSSIQQTQNMNLYSLFLGFELSTQKYLWGHLQGYFDAGLVPAWAQASGGTFSQDGTSNVYWAAKEGLGIAWRFAKTEEAPTADVALSLGVERTEGFGKGDLSDTGILTGLRLGL